MDTANKLGRDYRIVATIEKFEIIGETSSGLDSWKSKLSASVSGGQYVQYVLRINCTGFHWVLRKRFSDFASFHEALRALHPSVPELPAKTMTRNFSQEYLEQRKQLLNVYLNEVCKKRDLLNNVQLQEFFDLPGHLPEFKRPCKQVPVQVAQVHEACFSIVDFDYDHVEGLLLIGATDTSWTSRMDTKLTNIKFPWEASAPSLPSSQMTLWRQSSTQLHFEMMFCCKYEESIACVRLSNIDNNCLCGLSDGSVGCHAIQAESQVSSGPALTLPLLKHTAPVIALALDGERRWLISVSKDSAVFIYDTVGHKILCTGQTLAVPTAVHYCLEAKRLFIGMATGRFAVWDTSVLPIRELSMIPAREGTLSQIAAIDYHHASGTVFVASKEGLILWAVKYSGSDCWGRAVGQVSGIATVPTSLVWVNSSREVLAGFCNGAVCVFDVDKGHSSYVLAAHNNDVTKLAWSDYPRRLVTASTDKTLKFWDFPSECTDQLDLGQQPSFSRGESRPGALSSLPHPLASAPASGQFIQAGVSSASLASHPGNKTKSTRCSTAVRDDSDDDLAGWDH